MAAPEKLAGPVARRALGRRWRGMVALGRRWVGMVAPGGAVDALGWRRVAQNPWRKKCLTPLPLVA